MSSTDWLSDINNRLTWNIKGKKLLYSPLTALYVPWPTERADVRLPITDGRDGGILYNTITVLPQKDQSLLVNDVLQAIRHFYYQDQVYPSDIMHMDNNKYFPHMTDTLASVSCPVYWVSFLGERHHFDHFKWIKGTLYQMMTTNKLV